MNELTVEARAKVNLTLDVGAKRPDGYHNVETVMQTVSLSDIVDIRMTKTGEIRVMSTRADLPTDLHNLAGKAANAFLDHVGYHNIGVEVNITKRIPDRAGLAGGSADAAAVIRGLDKLLGTGLTDAELYALAASVGSDVPFCLYGGTALATGRGEVLTQLPELPECGILLVKPEFSVSTPALFAALDGRRVSRRPDNEKARKALGDGDLRALAGCLGNVFEEALEDEERRMVVDIKFALMAAGALGACMTGTGSAVFGIFSTVKDAEKADLSRFGSTFAVYPIKKL